MTRGGMSKSLLGLAVAVLMTASASFASLWGGHKSSVKSASITFASAMTLANGKMLEPGSYHMQVPENSKAPNVTFYKDGHAVAEAPAKVVTENQKNPYTEVDSTKQGNDNVINSIRPRGWDQKLVFNQTSEETTRAGQ